jgi:hypothetical protein
VRSAKPQAREGLSTQATADLSDLEWTAAIISARGGHPARLLKLLKKSLPGEAYEFVSATIKSSGRKNRGQRSRVDWQDAIVIRGMLRYHDEIIRRFGHDPLVRKAYGTKREMIAEMAAKYDCSVGTIRDIEAGRGSYAAEKRR